MKKNVQNTRTKNSYLLSFIAIASLALAGCLSDSDSGGSDPIKKNDDVVNTSTLAGTWESNCQFEKSSSRYFKEHLSITESQIKQTNHYYPEDDYECGETATDSSLVATASYTDEGTFIPDNAPDLKLHKLLLNINEKTIKTAVYATPEGNHLIINYSSDDLYPTSFIIENHYRKQGADFSPKGITQAVFGHWGYSLSTGEPDNSDLYTTVWSPTNLGGAWGSGIWITPMFQDGTGNIYISNQGKKSLAEVTKPPVNWPDVNTEITSVKQGEVYIIKRLDGGYAKIRILHDINVDVANEWDILVEYQLLN